MDSLRLLFNECVNQLCHISGLLSDDIDRSSSFTSRLYCVTDDMNLWCSAHSDADSPFCKQVIMKFHLLFLQLFYRIRSISTSRAFAWRRKVMTMLQVSR